MTVAKHNSPVDILIVGMGAAGGTAAKVLSEAGLKVLGLDRGPWLRPKEQFSGDELKFINRGYLAPDQRLSPRTFRTDDSSPAVITPFSSCVAQMVGGGTVSWAGWMLRPHKSDFLMRSLHGDIGGSSLVDWPIRYEQLEPYFTKVEWEFGVSGIAGADKYETPRTKDYPTPPLPPTRYGRLFYETCKKLGINAFPIPQAMVTKSHKGREGWNYNGFWTGYGDPGTAKSSTLTTFIPEALATGNFELRPDCYVRQVTVSTDGRAKGVIYIDADGQEVELEAKVVILCLGAIESARLMLMSRSPLFPDGLANTSGLVGKNATFHEYLFAVGLFDTEPLYGFAGTYISGGSFEFYETDEKRGHIGGALIGASMVGHPLNWAGSSVGPSWGIGSKDWDRRNYNHAMKIGNTLHDMPVETNRVDLDPVVRDAWGLPVARITHKSHPNDIQLAKWQVEKNSEILQAAGARQVIQRHLQGGHSSGNSGHQHGTVRMGIDPSKSVLNEWCQAHDVENLFVLDGSVFPTATGVNPTETIMANAWRCSDYIAESYAKGRSESLSGVVAMESKNTKGARV
jgi:choline dehydrogenase-like flavoprotein